MVKTVSSEINNETALVSDIAVKTKRSSSMSSIIIGTLTESSSSTNTVSTGFIIIGGSLMGKTSTLKVFIADKSPFSADKVILASPYQLSRPKIVKESNWIESQHISAITGKVSELTV